VEKKARHPYERPEVSIALIDPSDMISTSSAGPLGQDGIPNHDEGAWV